MEQFTATSPNFAQVSLPAPQARKFVLSRWRRRRCLNQGQRCGYPPGDYYKFEDRCHFAVSENTPNVPMERFAISVLRLSSFDAGYDW